MKPIYHLLFAATLLSGFAGCSKTPETFDEGPGTKPTNAPIEFQFGIRQTRTTTDAAYKSTFSEGDAVGVFVTRHGTALATASNYADNLKFVYADGEWSCPESSELYFPSDGSKLDFYAYSPYQAGVDPTNFTFTAADDQSPANFYAANDLLLAKALGVHNEMAALNFSHALTLVNVKILRGSDLAAFDDTFRVTLLGCNASSLVDLAAASATATGTQTAQIVMSRVESPDASTYNYRALVPAQQIAEGSVLFSFIQETPGKAIRFNYTTTAAAELAAADVSKWEIRLAGKPETYKVGDVYPRTGTPEGIVFEISEDGTQGKVVGLHEVPGRPDDNYKCCRWGVSDFLESENGAPDINSRTDGMTATQQLIHARKDAPNFPSDYSAFKYIYQTCNGNNPGGEWYMPAIEELKSLFAAVNGVVYTDIAATWTDGSKFSSTYPNNDPPATKDFRQKILDQGGEDLHFYGWYCTSTELDANTMAIVNFDQGTTGGGEKFNEWAHVRPIRKF